MSKQPPAIKNPLIVTAGFTQRQLDAIHTTICDELYPRVGDAFEIADRVIAVMRQHDELLTAIKALLDLPSQNAGHIHTPPTKEQRKAEIEAYAALHDAMAKAELGQWKARENREEVVPCSQKED